jgi:ribonuclease D
MSTEETRGRAGAVQLSSPGVLAQVAEQARASGRLALDTEFMGEGRYRTLLCLVQLAVPDVEQGTKLDIELATKSAVERPLRPAAEQPAPPDVEQGSLEQGSQSTRIELIDPLPEDLDGTPLAQVLADPEIEIVVHAGRQDIALLRRRFATDVRNVFDTQLAAGFAGMAAQSSYDSLLTQVLDVRLAKSASFTRWDARPLSPEQLRYAREDVVHLLELADELQSRLARLGRLQWARQECESLERASDERDLETIFARLPRIRGLSSSAQAVARELVQWREATAAAGNRPVQSVLGDAVLVEIAKRKPSCAPQLEEIRGAGGGAMRRRSEEVLAAVGRGRERVHEPLEAGTRPPPPDPADAPLIALSEALVRARAREADLAYELIAARADLQAIVAAHRAGGEPADVRTLRGWRRELVGGELLELLDGSISLSVAAGRLRID